MRFGVYLPDNREEDIKAIQGKAVLARLSGPSERRYHFYDRKLQENAGREREVAQSIDHALQTSEFVVYYQPKIQVLDVYSISGFPKRSLTSTSGIILPRRLMMPLKYS